MMGRSDLVRPTITAVIEDPVKNRDGRRVFARVVVSQRGGTYYARLTGAQGSGILTSMVKANGLAIIPETAEEVRPGEPVEVVILDYGNIQC